MSDRRRHRGQAAATGAGTQPGGADGAAAPAPSPGPPVPGAASGSRPGGQPHAGPLPALARLAIVLVLVEVAAFVAYAALVSVHSIAGGASSAGNVVGLEILLIAWGAALALCARGLQRRRRWARSPLVVSQLLLLLAVALPMAQATGSRVLGVLAIVVCATALAALLSRPVSATLNP